MGSSSLLLTVFKIYEMFMLQVFLQDVICNRGVAVLIGTFMNAMQNAKV
jgi:hypothetical protein